MCDIWKISNSPELPVEEFLKLPDSLRDINLSGGEPFLRKDLPEIVSVAVKTCPKARIVISTNGFATELILQQMKKILAIKPDIGIAVSIDGIGERHDEIRGIPGGFNKAMATVNGLQALGMTNLRLSFTILEKNITHLSKVYDLSRELGVQFTNGFAQSSEFYFGGKQVTARPARDALLKEYQYLLKQELKSWNLKRWLRAYFAYGNYKFITSREPMLSASPGRDFFFLDPEGIIYPSVVHNVPMGKIQNIVSFEQFWCSKEIEKMREQVDALKVPVWMICMVRTAMRQHPLSIMWWIVKNKISGVDL